MEVRAGRSGGLKAQLGVHHFVFDKHPTLAAKEKEWKPSRKGEYSIFDLRLCFASSSMCFLYMPLQLLLSVVQVPLG